VSFRKGNDFFKQKDYPNAIKWYSEAIAIDDTVPAYFSNRSASYAGLEDWENAAADGASCIACDKTFIKGYFRAATALENLKNYKKAVETLTMGLAIEPRNKVCIIVA
jgi:stress-induced-phosphoprotein 1